MTRRRLDPILLEVLRGQLQGVVEEMGELVMRCGHTVFVKETQDFVVALVTVRTVLAVISRTGFAPFGWYRIALGSLMLAVLYAR